MGQFYNVKKSAICASCIFCIYQVCIRTYHPWNEQSQKQQSWVQMPAVASKAAPNVLGHCAGTHVWELR